MKHGCPRRQQSQTMAKISKSYILTPPTPQGHEMSVKCEEPVDELTVQVWLLYDYLNFKYCTLSISGTELRTDRRTDGRTNRRTDGQTDGRTDDPNTRCPRRTFQAEGIKITYSMLNTQKVVITRAKMCETDLDRVTRIGLILFKRAMGGCCAQSARINWFLRWHVKSGMSQITAIFENNFCLKFYKNDKDFILLENKYNMYSNTLPQMSLFINNIILVSREYSWNSHSFTFFKSRIYRACGYHARHSLHVCTSSLVP